jgi:paraquat-inducible protein A
VGAVTFQLATAAQRGLAACGGCGLLSSLSPDVALTCPRCGVSLHSRKSKAVERTAALLLAAAICYVPANILPVLVTTTLGGTEPDTILGGVALLYESGSWVLAVVVLIASVMIPMGKIAVLVYLLFVVTRAVRTDQRQCTRLFRMVEFIGRWSMLDVFVDAFVVALVQLGPLMSVRPGPGVPFFAATAVLTMLAANAFDSRLMWDRLRPGGDHG